MPAFRGLAGFPTSASTSISLYGEDHAPCAKEADTQEWLACLEIASGLGLVEKLLGGALAVSLCVGSRAPRSDAKVCLCSFLLVSNVGGDLGKTHPSNLGKAMYR